MSRSFTVNSDHSENITFRDIIGKLYELKDLDKLVDMKDVYISKRVNNESTAITEDLLESSINEGYSSFWIDEGNIFVTFNKRDPDKFPDTYYECYYYIESRHLTGVGRDLWVAVASAIAAITGGTVSSADGAWDGDGEYSGDELWNEYLNFQREKDMEEYS
ncbi:MAG: hypothetical protein ACI4RG_01105 [Huintestinicola sp.]